MYDVTRKDSFEHARNWYDRAIQLGGENLETVLIGNKTDLPIDQREVSTEEGEMLANELGIPFIETSALNGSNVESAFVCMAKNIKKSLDQRGLTGVKDDNLKKTGGVQLASGEKKSLLHGCRCG